MEQEQKHPQKNDNPYLFLIHVEQPGINIKLTGTGKLTPLQQSILKTYTYHTVEWKNLDNPQPNQKENHDPDNTPMDTPEINNTLQHIQQDIPDTNNPPLEQQSVKPFSEQDIICPAHTKEIDNNAGLLQSLLDQLMQELESKFNIHNMTFIIHNFYHTYHHGIGWRTAENYAHGYKRYMIQKQLIKETMKDDKTPYFQKINEQLEPPLQENIVDTCIDSIRQYLQIKNSPSFAKGPLVLHFDGSFTEEEINEALSIMLDNDEIYQTTSTSFQIGSGSHVIQQTTGEKK